VTTRVIAIGQRAAGDDGVGPRVLDHLRVLGLPDGVEAHEISDASDLVPLVDSVERVVILDAVLALQAGQLVVLGPDGLSGLGVSPVSTHGITVAQALDLAKVLAPATLCPKITLVGITITQARRGDEGLSPDVLAEVDTAARLALTLVSG
jgi:hydrogenase maturation protease